MRGDRGARPHSLAGLRDSRHEHALCTSFRAMDHVDIEVTDGSILIFTDEGETIVMHVEPSSESVVKVMSSRPPSLVTVHGGD